MTEQTPITLIEKRSLPTARKGYDRAATDKLFEDLKASMSTLISERNAAQSRVQEFESRLAALEEREREITEALIVASRVRDQSEQEGKVKADATIQEAHAEAERIVADARSSAGRFEQEARDAELLAVRARQQLTTFLQSLLGEIERRGSDLGSVVQDLVKRVGEAGRTEAPDPDHVTSALTTHAEPTQDT
jgi:cell division septum initiation protein DivIVA